MLMFVSLLALSFLVVVFLPCRRRNHGEKIRHPRPPGPVGLPFIGNLHQMSNPAQHIKLSKLAKKHGPFMALRLGGREAVVISSSKIMKEVVKTHDKTFCGRPVLTGQQKLSYNGLNVAFSPCNNYWREMKKIYLTNLLGKRIANSFKAAREDEVSRMITKITLDANSWKPVNLSEYLISFINTLICRTAFGNRYADKDGYERKLFIETQAMVGSILLSDIFPALRWVDTITGKFAKLEKTFKDLDLFYNRVIHEHLNAQRPEPRAEDFVDVLLQLRNDRSASFEITLDHIKSFLLDIFIGGTDTTTTISTWVMTMLVKHPRVMIKVQQEIRMAVGNKGVVVEDDLHKFIYLKAVIKEAFRMYPPVGVVHRETTDKCIINGYEVSPKTHVFINLWAIGRDSEVWENPEDFIPERFLGSSIDIKGNDYGLIPFGCGKRICPGMNLAIPTFELALSNFLYSFDWGLIDGMNREDIDTEVLPGLTMHKKNDLCLMATNYSNT